MVCLWLQPSLLTCLLINRCCAVLHQELPHIQLPESYSQAVPTAVSTLKLLQRYMSPKAHVA